jgi:hypothetical protein
LQGLGYKGEEVRRAVEIMRAVLRRTTVAGPGAVTGKKAGGSGARKTKTRAAAIPAAVAAPGAEAAGLEARIGALVAANREAEDFRRLLGVNRFNEVTWFNKEAFEETLNYASLFLLAEDEGALGQAFASAASAMGGRAACIAALHRALVKAEEASGYSLDSLIKALSEV